MKFNKKKFIIGMIHLDYLQGQSGFKGMDFVIKKALEDLKSLESGGVDAIIVENWKDNTYGPFVDSSTSKCMMEVTKTIVQKTKLPVGINVLPNDYKVAFAIAKACGTKFVQLDVFVDKVKTDYSYSNAKPFEIKVNLKEFKEYRKKMDAEKILLFATIQPKHYKMLEKKSIQQSAKEAIKNGAEVIVVTGEVTGKAPVPKKVKMVKKAVGDKVPIFVGSGLNTENAEQLLKFANGAIVGTSFKDKNFEKVILTKVKKLVNLVKFSKKIYS